jgi:hypothetical protein
MYTFIVPLKFVFSHVPCKLYFWHKFCLVPVTYSALRKLNTEPSIGASHEISVHFGQAVSGKKFLEINHSKTRIACGGHVC